MPVPLPFALFGYAVAGGLFHYAMKRQHFRWQLLAESYRDGSTRPARAVRKMETFLMFGGGSSIPTRFAIVRIDVHDEGLSLRMPLPFSLYAPPLYLPFEEMTSRPGGWYGTSTETMVRMARGGDVEILFDDRLLAWIRESSGDRSEKSRDTAPF